MLRLFSVARARRVPVALTPARDPTRPICRLGTEGRRPRVVGLHGVRSAVAVCGRAKSAPGGAARHQSSRASAWRGRESSRGRRPDRGPAARPQPAVPSRVLAGPAAATAGRRAVRPIVRASTRATPPRLLLAGAGRARCGRRSPRAAADAGPGRRLAAAARARGRAGLRPTRRPLGRRPPRRRPARRASASRCAPRCAGTVTLRRASLAGRGVVVVDHGATRTTYEPVDRHRRTSATAVAAGDRIGTLELAGSHCFPRACLHWGWIEGDDLPRPARAWSAPARSGCCRCGGTSRCRVTGPGPTRCRGRGRPPVDRAAGRPLAAQARGCACW